MTAATAKNSNKDNIMEFPERIPYECSTAEAYTPCKLPKDVPDWWKDARKSAYDRFKEQGLPTQKLERFKYSNVAKAVSQWDGVLAEPKGDYPSDIVSCAVEKSETEAWVKDLLFANPPGLEKYADTALWDLNTAYFKYGGVVDIPAGEIVDNPIVLKTQGQDDTYTSLRFIMRVGDNAEVTLVEEFDGEGEYWRNRVSQFVLGKNAKVKHIRIVRDSDKAAYTQSSHVQLDRDANYECFTLTTGVGFTRHQVHVELNGQNGHASFDGLNLLSGKDHGDTTILIDHKAPHCTSNQFYRSLLNDKAHGIFQGKVHVFEGAQKTDGYQLSNAIILSETAQMDTKPELEIYADDVQCSHGATTGQLDDEPLFYLRSRGLSEKEAKQLLMQAFVGEVLDKIQNDDYRVKVDGYVDEWLKANL